MGSSIESAIAFSIIISMLAFIITVPINVVGDCIDNARSAMKEIEFQEENDSVISSKTIDGINVTDFCQERINTMIDGLIDSIGIIAGGFTDG